MNSLSQKFLSLILRICSAKFNTLTVPGLIYSLEQAIKYALLFEPSLWTAPPFFKYTTT